ncbi:MAG: hypothetical protein QOG83_3422 [Alphaproteobacteria bacterium]|nr:hypothetical protein [Alphaproteobacteria bacterium]
MALARQAKKPATRPAKPRRASTPPTGTGVESDTPDLSISREKVCFIVIKAREFDVKDLPTIPDDGSDPPDEGMRSVLEDRPDDPVRQELAAFISALTFDEQVDLVTLTWMGRGDGTIADWAALREEACGRHHNRTAHYLLGNPLLGDHLADGLAEFGYTCEEFAREHLA